MNVQAVENWALIKGRVSSIQPPAEPYGYAVATIAVEEVTPVSGYANMFAWSVGKEVEFNIPQAKVDEISLAEGDSISAKVRKASPTASFVDADSVVKLG